jgi:hypothetical protein
VRDWAHTGGGEGPVEYHNRAILDSVLWPGLTTPTAHNGDRLDPEHAKESLSEKEMFYLGEKYKAQVLAAMSSEHLIDMIMTVPTVHLKPSMHNTSFTASYHFDPLTNLQFTRDQQLTTAKVRESESGPGGLTREVDRLQPSNHFQCDHCS